MYTTTKVQMWNYSQLPCKICKTYVANRKTVEHKKKRARNKNVNKSRKFK